MKNRSSSFVIFCGESQPPPTNTHYPSTKITTTYKITSKPQKITFSVPVAASHTLTAPSIPTVATVAPSGMNANPTIQPRCPTIKAISVPVATSQKQTTTSLPTKAILLPSNDQLACTT